MKPQNLAQLLRYLPEHPHLELHMPAARLIVQSNVGPVDMSMLARSLPRTFRRKQGTSLVFGNESGKDSFLSGAAKHFKFFDDRFECQMIGGGEPLRYYYKDAPHTEAPNEATANVLAGC